MLTELLDVHSSNGNLGHVFYNKYCTILYYKYNKYIINIYHLYKYMTERLDLHSVMGNWNASSITNNGETLITTKIFGKTFIWSSEAAVTYILGKFSSQAKMYSLNTLLHYVEQCILCFHVIFPFQTHL